MKTLLSKVAATSALAGMMMLAPFSANAATVSVVVEGTVTSVDTLLETEFTIGDPFRLTYTFDSTTPDSLPADPLRGSYLDAISSLTVTVGSYSSSLGFTGSSLSISNNLGGADGYTVILEGASGPSAAGLFLAKFNNMLFMQDDTAMAFDSDALPVEPLDPLDFPQRSLSLQFCADDADICSNPRSVFASLDSFEFSLGGSVTGLSLNRVICINRTTGQRVDIVVPEGESFWNCPSAGLEFLPGDRIIMIEGGIAE